MSALYRSDNLHGKEGVDGSSPSEGLLGVSQGFFFPEHVVCPLGGARTWCERASRGPGRISASAERLLVVSSSSMT